MHPPGSFSRRIRPSSQRDVDADGGATFSRTDVLLNDKIKLDTIQLQIIAREVECVGPNGIDA